MLEKNLILIIHTLVNSRSALKQIIISRIEYPIKPEYEAMTKFKFEFGFVFIAK
jgi:hypothetical protein